MSHLFKNDRTRSDFLYQLSSLLNEGYTLSEAINMQIQFSNSKRKKWLESVYFHLLHGDALTDQFVEVGFPKEILSYLTFMERYGDIRVGLYRASDILKKRYEFKEKLRKVVHYPFLLLIGFMIMGVVMVEGVLPQFALSFQSMNQELPFLTRIILVMSQWLGLPFFVACAMILLIVIMWFRRKPVIDQVGLALSLPLVKHYLRQLLTYYFTSQFYPLLKNGFSLKETLNIIEKSAYLTFFQQEAHRLRLGLEAGHDLADLVSEVPFYLPQLYTVISMGESKGDVGREFERFSEFLFHQMYENTYKVLQVFQPAILCIIGIGITILFLSMMLPVLSIMDAW
ncbi:type II secretion system F family protein [Salipaludibacillus agaradhaerens]|uniref:Type II secretion system F family protein n=1 Tax=Salipaludibacillus agaradhaerens TaxID=76935 RepID=A0A9Q4B1M2_SALAG|nr:competence type IV pilus assembly protein ComGB [Salipaludibacillus agaradhaerens]MCR6096703.1 type II secretion system F family protein [Salipaludibacillus agaradhaerens]MCR6113738.1 type II secretion system F family protein [Salipaludibacillus agaradhaerens]